MNDYTEYFAWKNVDIEYFYIYFFLAAVMAFYLVFRSKSQFKIEMFVISFYLLTGNLNKILTLKIPGFSLFEIQPIRFIYLMLLWFIIRKTLLSRKALKNPSDAKIPWFEVALYGYIICLALSIFVNIFPQGLKTILDAVAFVILIKAFQVMSDQPSYDLIGKSLIIGAVVTSLVSFVQLFVDPYFLRIGDERVAFGNILRTNGIFDAEYLNSYYLIIAIAWVLITVKKGVLKSGMVILFSLAILTTFMRMSWIILALVLTIYFLFIKKVAIEKMLVTFLAGVTILLSVSIFYYQDIMNSSLVKERLSDSVDSRYGYYNMVFDNIGKKPFLGYGDLNNEVFYVNLLRITGSRDRATGKTGSLHSGYFTTLFLYGIPAFVFFTAFAILSVIYYSKSFKYNMYFVLPFLVSIIFMVGNLTNTFLFISYLSVLYALHIGIGMGIKNIEAESTIQKQKLE